MSEQTFILPRLLSRERTIDRIASVLKGLDQGRSWRISVAEHKIKRSDAQNRYLWGCVYRTILDSGQLQGWEAEDIHEYLLGEWAGWETLIGFGKKRLRPIRRSSTLNKLEFSDYVDFIQRKMATLGIFIPDANSEAAA